MKEKMEIQAKGTPAQSTYAKIINRIELNS